MRFSFVLLTVSSKLCSSQTDKILSINDSFVFLFGSSFSSSLPCYIGVHEYQ